MKRCTLLIFVATLLTSTQTLTCSAAHDVQCYNRDRGKIATPHIDRLATQGMRFTDAQSSSGVCSPSRYTPLTGRYQNLNSAELAVIPIEQLGVD